MWLFTRIYLPVCIFTQYFIVHSLSLVVLALFHIVLRHLHMAFMAQNMRFGYITWWIGLDTFPMIIVGGLSTTLLMYKPLWMHSTASIQKNLAFRTWQLIALFVLRGGGCHEY